MKAAFPRPIDSKWVNFVERHPVQLIHHPGAHLHQPVSMPQQLSQIAILCVGYPDSRETIFDHRSQQQLRVLAIGLLLPYPFGTILGRIPDPQLKL
jgi:hypothetical protein